MSRSSILLNRQSTGLIVIDVQKKLFPVIHNNKEMVDNCVKLIEGFKALDLPIYVTEQYPEGLGNTVKPIQKALGKISVKEKMTFSCMGIEGFTLELRKEKLEYLVLCGIETHVCLWQSSMDFLHEGFSVVVDSDCVSSRKESDKITALSRMAQNGVQVASTEMILFELLENTEGEEFKKILSLIK